MFLLGNVIAGQCQQDVAGSVGHPLYPHSHEKGDPEATAALVPPATRPSTKGARGSPFVPTAPSTTAVLSSAVKTATFLQHLGFESGSAESAVMYIRCVSGTDQCPFNRGSSEDMNIAHN